MVKVIQGVKSFFGILSNIYIYIGCFVALATVCVFYDDSVSAAPSSSVTFTASMNEVSLDIAVSDDDINVILDSTASLETADFSAYVTTAAPYGYTLMMTSNTSDLVRTESLNGDYPVIPTLEKDSTQVGFAVNHWGWKLASDAQFHPFESSGAQIGYSDSPTNAKEEVITLAAKANSVTPVGDYKITLTITGVANSRPISIDDVVYMQDLVEATEADKSSILASMTEGTSYTLKDSRDEKEYTIAKLFDGNIWMTKNLDLAGGTVLTSEKSNVVNDYTLPNSSSSGWNSDSTAYVYNSGSTTCGNKSPCYSYYSYIAATAGTNPSSGDAISDICPAGWRLPTEAEYETLMGEYTTGSTITALPFLGSYAYYYLNGTFRTGETNGLYWTSTATSSTNARLVYFTPSVAELHTDMKRYGLSVRCLAK